MGEFERAGGCDLRRLQAQVAAGRKLPLDKVQEIARGRVWTGADASSRGSSMVSALLGGRGHGQAARKIDATNVSCSSAFPRQKSFSSIQRDLRRKFRERARCKAGDVDELARDRAVVGVTSDLPRGGVEMRATNPAALMSELSESAALYPFAYDPGATR